MRLLYSLFIYLYGLSIRIAAMFNTKAKKWVEGRQTLFETLAVTIKKEDHPIWIHCASLGEFEQGRPIIEALRKTTSKKILLTFFSPSGFEIRQHYPKVDYVMYLPLDTPKAARRFIALVQPCIAIFVKYEFWLNLLQQLHLQSIPHYLISASFRPNQIFFRWYGQLFYTALEEFQHIFVQDQASLQLLKKHKIEQVSLVGDTRVDRVLDIAALQRLFPEIDRFKSKQRLLIAGSTWPPDEDLLAEMINNNYFPNWKFIIVPHEISDTHLQKLEQKLKLKTIRYSQINNSATYNMNNILIIDNIGMLSALYRYGDIAYIGGGFGAGIHNILEAAAFELPIIFGSNYEKFKEARELINLGGAFTIANKMELRQQLLLLMNPQLYNATRLKIKQYMKENKGATSSILSYLKVQHSDLLQ